MENMRFWKPVIHQLCHPHPRDPILLATPPQRSSPEVGDVMQEHLQCSTVGGHRVVIEVATGPPASAIAPARGWADACAVAAPVLFPAASPACDPRGSSV